MANKPLAVDSTITERHEIQQSSYVHGVSLDPLRGITVGDLLEETASRFPDDDHQQGVKICHAGHHGRRTRVRVQTIK